MARGGERKESGRKVGSRDKETRMRRARLSVTIPTAKQLRRNRASGKPVLAIIEQHMSEESGKLYKTLFRKYDDPMDALKVLLDDMMVRYNYGRICEIEGTRAAKQLAVETIKQLNEQGESKTAAALLETINKGPVVSKNLTHLSGEIRQIGSLIYTIESGGGQGKKNIFLIFNDSKLAKQAESRLFRVPKEIIDVQVIKDENNDNS